MTYTEKIDRLENDQDYKRCECCGEVFDYDDINEYGNCPECELNIQKEKQSIQDTENTLQNFR